MLDSYFMVPGDNPRFLSKIKEFKADYFVIDLEESVSNNNKIQALDNLRKLEVGPQTFVRIPIKENIYSKDQLTFLISKFGGRIVFPKVRKSGDLESLFAIHDFTFPLNLIILVENPECLFNLADIIKDHIDHIRAVGFGSHDFCSVMGVKHDLDHLSYYRNQLILLTKAFGIEYIDGVDLNIRDLSDFEKECIYVFESGGDGKFLIHPDQLEKMYTIEYLSEEEIKELTEVHQRASSINNNDIDIIEFQGKVFERPQLQRIQKLMNKLAQRTQ